MSNAALAGHHGTAGPASLAAAMTPGAWHGDVHASPLFSWRLIESRGKFGRAPV
jgi:hypothetical protein